MAWQDTLNARGWKVPFLGKSLFQIGKELRPKIDKIIMDNSRIPDAALQDKSFWPWIAKLEERWEDIRDEAVRIRAEDIPSLGDISFDHGRIAADRRWGAFFLKGYGLRWRAMPGARRSPRNCWIRFPGLLPRISPCLRLVATFRGTGA